MSTLKIWVIYDNDSYKKGFIPDWGFACVVEIDGKKLLFDTGADGKILLSNMKEAEISPSEIEIVVLSHIHGDHTGGLFDFLKENPKVKVYLPSSFPENFKQRVKDYGAEIFEIQKFQKIFKNVYSTGELGTWIKEQGLVVNIPKKGLIVITGCAHPGIVEMVERAKKELDVTPFLVMGGFHLGGKSRRDIEVIILNLRHLGVKYVGPCHCSGNEAKRLFKEYFKEKFIEIGAGRVIDVGNL